MICLANLVVVLSISVFLAGGHFVQLEEPWFPDCANNPDALFPDPTDCGSYWQCDSAGNPVHLECPGDLHFNAETGVCDYPEDAGCENQTTVSTSPSTTASMSSTTSVPCEGDWIESSSGCFYFSPVQERVTFYDAEILCNARGGHLAEVRTAGENEFIIQHLYQTVENENMFYNDFWWLDASDAAVEGQWVWKWSGHKVDAGFQNWAEGEPDECLDGSCDQNDCLVMHRYFGDIIEYHWSDQSCDVTASFICQKS